MGGSGCLCRSFMVLGEVEEGGGVVGGGGGVDAEGGEGGGVGEGKVVGEFEEGFFEGPEAGEGEGRVGGGEDVAAFGGGEAVVGYGGAVESVGAADLFDVAAYGVVGDGRHYGGGTVGEGDVDVGSAGDDGSAAGEVVDAECVGK